MTTESTNRRDEDQRLHVEHSPDGTGIFDAHHPPSDDRISDCVHCGFCLPTCPTYTLWGEEMDSPRGRVYLMKLGKEGAVPFDDIYVQHFDACLGCMACVTACPSGVRYDELIEAVRPQIERNYRRSTADRAFREMIFQLFPYPTRLRAAAVLGVLYQRAGGHSLLERSGLSMRLPARLRAVEELMPPAQLRGLTRRLPAVIAAEGTARRRRVAVLAREGCEVVVPRGQRCCGALSEHAGREPEALKRARRLIDDFHGADVDAIVVNVAGCGSTMKEYGRLLRDDPKYAERAAAFSAKVRDISEVLADLEPVAPRHPIEARVAYHDACHLSHGQGVRLQPRAVLRTIPDLEVIDIPEAEICCGSAGIYNMVNPDAGADLGRRKTANIMSVAPDAVATGNPGCLLQIRRYLAGSVPMFHPIQLVDASIQGVDPIQARERRATASDDARTPGPGRL
jgi:glycolate oxidase iron-sulfur subunit